MTEVFYPTLDVPNVQMLQLVVVSDDGKLVETEAEDSAHRIEVLDPQALLFRQINTAKSGSYSITKTYVTDPERNTVLIAVEFAGQTANNLYVYYDPSLNNSGMHDSAWTEDDALLAMDGDKASALISSSGFVAEDEVVPDTVRPFNRAANLKMSNGFLGSSDGLTELRKNRNRSGFT